MDGDREDGMVIPVEKRVKKRRRKVSGRVVEGEVKRGSEGRSVQEELPMDLAQRSSEASEIFSDESLESVKHILESKMVWVNIIALVALIAQNHFGFTISEELQVELLTIINIILRIFFTKDKIVWNKKGEV